MGILCATLASRLAGRPEIAGGAGFVADGRTHLAIARRRGAPVVRAEA
jgi:hypothetical protein